MKKIALSLAFFVGLFSASAQKTAVTEQPTATYTVQLGAFDDNVKQADFEAIRSYAYIHKREGLVFIGGFASEEAAQPVLAKVKAKGYDDAFVASRSFKKAKNVHIIQLASKNAGEAINWASYAKVGDLFSLSSGSLVRIVHGYYMDINDARVKLKEIQNMGFTDAFVKTVKDVQLNSITDFDTGDKKLLFMSDEKVGVKGIPTNYVVMATKRKSALKLQEALKEVGTYGGTVDGQFGKGSAAAYDKALKLNRRLVAFNEMAQKHEGFEGWEDVRLLVTMARDLNVKEEAQPIIADLLSNLTDTPLSTKDMKTAFDWHSAMWKGMEKWSTLSQYNDQVYTALKVAYYHSLVHLEDYYATKGIKGEAATALGVSAIKTLIGEDLDGFK
jgi:SPOR domain